MVVSHCQTTINCIWTGKLVPICPLIVCLDYVWPRSTFFITILFNFLSGNHTLSPFCKGFRLVVLWHWLKFCCCLVLSCFSLVCNWEVLGRNCCSYLYPLKVLQDCIHFLIELICKLIWLNKGCYFLWGDLWWYVQLVQQFHLLEDIGAASWGTKIILVCNFQTRASEY